MLKNNRGLTLIEVLLTLALLTIVLSTGFSIFGLSGRVNTYVTKEYYDQTSIRMIMKLTSDSIMKASAVFLHRSVDDVFTDDIYDFDDNYEGTLRVDNDYMNGKGRGNEFKEAVEEKYKGWNFFVLSEDRKELRNFIYNEDDEGNYYYILKRVRTNENVTFELTFSKPLSNGKNNIVEMILTAEDSNGQIEKISTEIEALNSLQVVNRGSSKEPARVLFYRTEERPMTEDVSGALTFVLDTSGSMSQDTQYKGENKSKIEALKEVTIDYINKLSDRLNLKIGIVEFNTTAHDPQSLLDASDNGLLEKINNLQAGGGTNIGDGIRRAYHILKAYNDMDESNKDANKYMIILMDGVPTYGAIRYDYSNTNTIKQNRDRGKYWNYNGTTYYNYKTDYFLFIPYRWYYGKMLNITSYDDNISYNNSQSSMKPGFALTGDGSISSSSIEAGMGYIDDMVERMNQDNMKNLKIFLIGFFTNSDNSVEEDNFSKIEQKLTANGRIVKPYNAKDGTELEEAMHAINNIILNDYWHIYGPKE